MYIYLPTILSRTCYKFELILEDVSTLSYQNTKGIYYHFLPKKKKKFMDSQTYDELHGSNNWVGLLDPLDLNLRTLLLGYGDLSSAAERAFNNDEGSNYNGYSHYGKSSFFKGAMLPWAESKYQVTSFIYATASVNSDLALLFPGMSRDGSEFKSNWMGYVAVSNDEFSKSIGRREIGVVLRGTVRNYEWIDDIMGAMPVPATPLLPDANLTGVAPTSSPLFYLPIVGCG